jgi:uncharacterized lipoprotein NlpE involved in copper resistance
MKKVLSIILLLFAVLFLIGCESDADIASRNLLQAADQFGVTRRIVFYNGITGDYILVIEDLCSLGNCDDVNELTVTCKTGATEYKKHFLGLSDNVTFFAEQLDPVSVSEYHYRVIFKPESILPDIDLEIESSE